MPGVDAIVLARLAIEATLMLFDTFESERGGLTDEMVEKRTELRKQLVALAQERGTDAREDHDAKDA